jgi:alkanesulfonate monooxygenase SsuD/methylene tetrahydromethanopterin reductase-like flavin-dependent oxidoreductase (luciferase family)
VYQEAGIQLVVTMGIRQLPSHPRPLHELYRDHLEEAVLAEELGFDNVWASEHHFAEDAWNPSPITFLAAVAARTERVRIGTYVLLLPFHNPVRVAEDIAVLDNLSGGRVDLPVGVGSAVEEFRTFGIPFNERLGRTFEALSIIERCFAGETFGHNGKYYDFPDVRMTTTPVQKPGPPIWVASMGFRVSPGRRGAATTWRQGQAAAMPNMRSCWSNTVTTGRDARSLRSRSASTSHGHARRPGMKRRPGCTRSFISTARGSTSNRRLPRQRRSKHSRQSASFATCPASDIAALRSWSGRRTRWVGRSRHIATSG